MEDLAQALATGLERLLTAGNVEIRENGARLAALANFSYEVRQHSGVVLLHLWSKERNLVRRVVGVVADDTGRLAVEAMRLESKRPSRLEFVAAGAPRPAGQIAREEFASRFRELLAQQFPDEKLASLTTAPDLKHSLSGNYARGLLQSGSQLRAVLGAAPGESAATYDAIATFGLLWLDRARASRRGKSLAGLRLFFPAGVGRVTAHRMQALSPSTAVELYEYDAENWRARRVNAQDAGNLDTWLAPRRETEAALAAVAPAVERIRKIAPAAIAVEVIPGTSPGTKEIALRFRGLTFARVKSQGGGEVIYYGPGDPQQPLTPDRRAEFDRLLRDLEKYRSPVATATRHSLYRAQPERWLETLVAADPGRIDARLDPRFVYAQVPALSAADRSVIDLLCVTRSARLAVLELKVAEDPHLVLQAMDYWLRVRWHHAQQDFSRFGYFPGLTLDPRPPLLFLVAPAIRFHSATDILLRYLGRDIEITRVGVSENWRRGLKVVLRQG
jgi:hypothetical protein